MKKVLCATTLAVITTTAFGAASLRAPQLGGAATATPATAPATTARAGTMRAQTMKTSMSTSNATPTTTASISEPIATETTDARLSFLKGIKNLNSGKVKDTTAATNELNSLNNRIEELQSKLDAAESAQATVLTESNIDAKIDEKLTALGTTSTETYSKTDIDNLLNEIKRKLPTFDDNGDRMTWTDPNGNLINQSIWQLTAGPSWYPVTAELYYFVSLPSNQQSVEKIIAFARNKCNNWDVSPQESFACGARQIRVVINDPEFGTGYTFIVVNHFKGWAEEDAYPQIIHQNGQVIYRNRIRTYEYNTLAALKTAVCGETPSDWCDVYDFSEGYDDGLGIRYLATMERRLREGLTAAEIPTVNEGGDRMTWTDPNGTLISMSMFQLNTIQQNPLHDILIYSASLPNTEQSLEKIRNWVQNTCNRWNTMSPGEILVCGLFNPTDDPGAFYDNGAGFWWVKVKKVYTGYKAYQDPEVFANPDGSIVFRKYLESFEYDTEDEFHAAACGDRSADECQVSGFRRDSYFAGIGLYRYRATVDYIYATKNSGE
ncbi:MAG: hypothetical protein J5714_04730 [Alphaproteobacteria bacterium]|nr:hypothetical protein [Alphaproteobacteria bacterium]